MFVFPKPLSRMFFIFALQFFKNAVKSAAYSLSFKHSNIKITKLSAISHTESVKDRTRNNFQSITVIPQFIKVVYFIKIST